MIYATKPFAYVDGVHKAVRFRVSQPFQNFFFSRLTAQQGRNSIGIYDFDVHR